jgi:hypothetical protein
VVALLNISPFGAVDNPIIGRIVDAGETFDVPADIAGRAPKGDDPGEGLLAQAEHFQRVKTPPAKKTTAPRKPKPVTAQPGDQASDNEQKGAS